MNIKFTLIFCVISVTISFFSIAYPLTNIEKEKMIEATKNQKYDVVSKIMLKEYKENCLILLKSPKKSNFKSIEQLIFLYSEGFTKLYIINAKKNGYLFETEKDIGMIKVRFIIELYDIYKNLKKGL